MTTTTTLVVLSTATCCLALGIVIGRKQYPPPPPPPPCSTKQHPPKKHQQQQESNDKNGTTREEGNRVEPHQEIAENCPNRSKGDDKPTTTTTRSTTPLRRRTLQDEMTQQGGDNGNSSITLQPIGIVRSVYSLCVGTPRQGLLAPAARGRIELSGSAADAVDGLTAYSHIWVVFVFHLNTQSAKKQKKPSKIAPPAAGGRRVGVWSTRSPHRPAPVGLSLVHLNGIRTERRPNGKKPQLVTVLDISGLDLVDGTPVLDIKPHVPVYDTAADCRIPDWVADGLQTFRRVAWTAPAVEEFETIMATQKLQFYQPHEVDIVQDAIQQVLSMDVRSPYQTKKARQGAFQAERSHRITQKAANPNDNTMTCTQQLDNLLIHYTVQAAVDVQRAESMGSGAEDVVHVTSIQYLPPASEN